MEGRGIWAVVCLGSQVMLQKLDKKYACMWLNDLILEDVRGLMASKPVINLTMFVYTKTKFGTYLENLRPESHDRLPSHYVPQATSNDTSEMELRIEEQ